MRSSFWLKIGVLLFLLAWVGPSTASAIEVYGRIRGVVTDPSGAVVVGATVTATNTETGISSAVTTGTDGSFEFVQLPAPASYDLKCEKTGFKVYRAAGINLRVTQVYVQNFTMEVGAVTQSVTVEAAPVQVEKTSMQLSATITSTQIVDLPLNGRNWTVLQQTLPGVVAAADGRGNYATNGSQPGQNSFLINGIDTNDLPLNTPLIVPSPDAIAEVKMITNTINPEYGRNSGAIMNAVTKSGSNAFHGSGFEFFRDTGLNARNFFQPSAIVFHQHQFGGTVGGPIKKDKAFFFFSYQGTRARQPGRGTGTSTVFTQNQRDGIWGAGAFDCTIDTSDGGAVSDCPTSPVALVGDASSPCPAGSTTCPAGTRYGQVWDTASGSPVLVGSAGNGLFSTGNIPTTNFNALAVSLTNQFVPLPNSGGTEYDFTPVNKVTADQFISRVDYNLTNKDALWGSWFYQTNPNTDTIPFSGADLPGFPMQNGRHSNAFSLTWNHTFNGTTFNEFRLGYTRFYYLAVNPVNIVNPADVGFTGIKVQEPSMSSWPVIGVEGFFTLGFSTNGPQPRLDQTRQLDDNFTKIVGTHTFKAGINVRRFGVYNPFSSSLSGNYTFDATSPYSTGNPGADFLLGFPDDYGQGTGDVIDAQAMEYYLYFQDQWKVRKNLTLTYGLGYQIDTPTRDVYHDGHAMTAWRPGETSTIFPNAPTNYLFEGDPGIHAAGTTKYNHFGPRIGFAWSPGSSGKWAIRGGYGIYFNKMLEEQTLQFLNQPPFSFSSSGIGDYGGYYPNFGNPWMDVTGTVTRTNKFPAPTNPPSTVDFSPYLPTWVTAFDPNSTVPYAQNFNLTVERQLSPNTVLSVAYVGALGRKNVILRELNPGRDPEACLADPTCVAYRSLQGLVYPQYFRYDPYTFYGIGNDQTTGISNYNSMQVVFNKHMSHGLQLYATYTWSHAMDDGSGYENSGFGGGGFGGYGSVRAINPFNQSFYNYGPSAFDARQRLTFSYTYLIPPPRHFDNWAAKRFFEGWRMSGTTYLQTGFPLDVVDSSYRSLTCWAGTWTACWDVPDMPSSPKYYDPRSSSLTNTVYGTTRPAADHYWFDPNTFARAPLGVQGNAGRNPLRGPGIANFDWAFMKDTQISETTRMELRFEFYNLFNHTQFDPAGISTNVNSTNFGRILAARDPRVVQLAAKFYF